MFAVADRTAEERETRIRLGELLRDEREAYGARIGRNYYQRDAAKLLDIKENTYRTYEYGRARLSEEHARVLASEWGISYRKLLGLEPAESKAPEVGPPKRPKGRVWIAIPSIGGVGANSKADWVDPVASPDEESVPADMANDPEGPPTRFACKVLGDSCYDLLLPGDIAIFEKSDIPKLNHIMIHRSPDNRLTIKQVRHNGRTFILHPLNPEYDDEPASGVFVGYLVGFIRQIGSGRLTRFDPFGIVPGADSPSML